MDDGPSRYDKLESMLQDGSSGLRNLPLDYLKSITNNFSDERLLGEGGFGTVYKGVLPSGETIAVKKLNSPVPGVKDRHFENEAYHLMRLKHPNVVLLVGWCSETEDIYVQYNGKYICAEKSERLLCLEYMPKGSLRGYLSDEASGLGGTRYKIIEGICYGLHYLHEKCQHNGPIIHMDLKPANILLENIFLSRRHIGVRSNDHCVMCSLGEDETLNHLLFTCPFERSCWAAIHVAWDLSVSLENRIIHGIQHSGLEFFVELALIAAWELWKLRNDKIFNRHEPSFARWLHNFKAQCRLQVNYQILG